MGNQKSVGSPRWAVDNPPKTADSSLRSENDSRKAADNPLEEMDDPFGGKYAFLT
ncbi:MAG: hypothetical protein PHF37_04975 [Phycisphaerae bacterium]|nr:hypothetical protein [Phycisphaerae bacterium]